MPRILKGGRTYQATPMEAKNGKGSKDKKKNPRKRAFFQQKGWRGTINGVKKRTRKKNKEGEGRGRSLWIEINGLTKRVKES